MHGQIRKLVEVEWTHYLPPFNLPFDSISSTSSSSLSPCFLSLPVKQIVLWKLVAFHLHWETLSGRKTHSLLFSPSPSSQCHIISPMPCSLSFSSTYNLEMLICALRLEQSCLSPVKIIFGYLEGLFLLYPHTLCPAEPSVGWIKCHLPENTLYIVSRWQPAAKLSIHFYFFFSCEWYWAVAHTAWG